MAETSAVSGEGMKNCSVMSQDTAASPQLHSSTSRLNRLGLKDRVKKLIDNSQIKDKKALNDGLSLLFNPDDTKKLPDSVLRKLVQWGDPFYRKRMKEHFKTKRELIYWEYLDDLTAIKPFDFLTNKTDLKTVELRKNFIKHLRNAVKQRYTVKELQSQRPTRRRTVKDKNPDSVEREEAEEAVEDWEDSHIFRMLPFSDIATVKIRKKLDAQIRAGKKLRSDDFWTHIVNKELYAACPRLPSLAYLYKKMADFVQRGSDVNKNEDKLFTEDVENTVTDQMANVIHGLVTNALTNKIVSYVEEKLPEMLMAELAKYRREDDSYPGGMDKDAAQALTQRVTNRILSEVPLGIYVDAVVHFFLLKRKAKYMRKFYFYLNRKKPISNVTEDDLELLRKVLPSDLNKETDYLKRGIVNFLSVHVSENMFKGLIRTDREIGSNDKQMAVELRRQGDEMLKRAKRRKFRGDNEKGRSRFARPFKDSVFAEGFKRNVLDVRVNQIIYGITSKTSLAAGRKKSSEAFMTMHRLRQLLEDEKEPRLVPYKPSGVPENIKQHITEQTTIGRKERGLIKRLLKRLPPVEGMKKIALLDDDPLVVEVGDAADAYIAAKVNNEKNAREIAAAAASPAGASGERHSLLIPCQREHLMSPSVVTATKTSVASEVFANNQESSASFQSRKMSHPQLPPPPTAKQRSLTYTSITSKMTGKWKPEKEKKLSYTVTEREEFGDEYFMDWDDEDEGTTSSSESVKLQGQSRTDATSVKATDSYPSRADKVKSAPEPPNYLEWLSETYDPNLIPSGPIRLQNIQFLRKTAGEFLEDKNDKLSWKENAINVFVPPVKVNGFEPFEKLGIEDSRFEMIDGCKVMQPWTKSFNEKCLKEQLRTKKRDSMESWLGPSYFEFPDPLDKIIDSKRQKFSTTSREAHTTRHIGPATYAPPNTLKASKFKSKEQRYKELIKLTKAHKLKNDALPPTLYTPKIPGTVDYNAGKQAGNKGPFYSKSKRTPQTLPGRFRPNETGKSDFINPDSTIQRMLKKPKYGKWTVKKKKLKEIVESGDDSTNETAAAGAKTIETAALDNTSRKVSLPPEFSKMDGSPRQNRAPFNSNVPRFAQEIDETGIAMPAAVALKRHCKIPIRSPFKSKTQRWNPAKTHAKYNIFE